MLTVAPGSDDPPQAISQPRTSALPKSTVPAFSAHRRSRPTPPRRRIGPSAYRVTAPQRPVRPPHQSPIVQPSWRRTLHRISRSSTIRGDPDEHIDRGPQQAPRPGARQAPRPGSSAILAGSRRTTAETLSLWLLAHELNTWTTRHLHGRRTRLAASRPTGAPRLDDPIIATSRWGRPAHWPPHCSPMGISWGSIPQGSPLTNHSR